MSIDPVLLPFWNGRVEERFRPDARAVMLSGDCRETLRRLPDGVAKLVVTWPPYNIGKASPSLAKPNRKLV